MYPATLDPRSSEKYQINGRVFEVPKVTLAFKPWQGPLIANTFGGKPLVDFEGKPMFAELAIQKIAEKGGWSSRWIETYAMKGGIPYFFTYWIDGPLTKQSVEPIADLHQANLLKNVAKHNGDSYYGCWDVLAWKGDRTIFLESKRTKRDSVRNTQLKWLEAGINSGLTIDNFLIVQWDFYEPLIPS